MHAPSCFKNSQTYKTNDLSTLTLLPTDDPVRGEDRRDAPPLRRGKERKETMTRQDNNKDNQVGTQGITLLKQVLGRTPRQSAANWFGISVEELDGLLRGECAMSPEIIQRARDLLGSGSSPWLKGMNEGGVEKPSDIDGVKKDA